jgi:hypothetical protein
MKTSKPLNILIGADDFSRKTGMPYFILTLSRELIRRGHSIMIVAPQIGLVPAAEIPQRKYVDFNADQFQPDIILLN